MKTVEIKVTSKDIQNGQPNAYQSCPIALAANRVGIPASVDEDTLGFEVPSDTEEGGDYVSVGLPEKARKFVDRFDDLAEVKPFSFRIKLEDNVVKALKINKRYIVGKTKKVA